MFKLLRFTFWSCLWLLALLCWFVAKSEATDSLTVVKLESIGKGIDRLEDWIDRLEDWIDRLEDWIDRLEDRIDWIIGLLCVLLITIIGAASAVMGKITKALTLLDLKTQDDPARNKPRQTEQTERRVERANA